MPPDPLATAPCSYSWLFFSNQLPASNFIETPELINNSRAREMVAEVMVEHESKLNLAHRASMTTCERHPPGTITLTKDTYHIITMETRRMHGLRDKLNKICPAAKNTQNDLISKAKIYNLGAPA